MQANGVRGHRWAVFDGTLYLGIVYAPNEDEAVAVGYQTYGNVGDLRVMKMD